MCVCVLFFCAFFKTVIELLSKNDRKFSQITDVSQSFLLFVYGVNSKSFPIIGHFSRRKCGKIAFECGSKITHDSLFF